MAQAERALYLAWRPRTFDDVVGQHHVVRTIRNAVVTGSLAHAYLFAGPRGTGKTTMARLLFKAANCLDPRDGAPDERCAICASANEGRALDLIEMDAASNRGIDDVRDLRDKINYAPGEARYRVYILDEAHQLTQPAWDALLKTLEEPPPHAILVLATTEAHKVPATVLSRCQRFDFHRISAVEIRDRLAEIARRERIDVEPTVLAWLARAARGGLRDAIGLLDQLRAFSGDRIDAASAREVLGLAGLETVRPFLLALEEDRPGDALEELNGALERGTDLRVYVADALAYLRALLLLRYGARTTLQVDFPAEEIAWLEERVAAWEAPRLRGLVGGFGDAMARFRDPGQLLVQVELALLAGWDAPETGIRPPPAGQPLRTPRPAMAAETRRPAPLPAPAEPARPSRRDGPSRAATDLDVAPPAAPTAAAPTPTQPPAELPTLVAATPGPTPETPSPPADVPASPAGPNGLGAAGGMAETSAVYAPPSHPPLDAADLRARWVQLQAQVAGTRAGQFWFHRCDLHDVEGDTLVLRLDQSLRTFVDGRDRRMAIEREIGRVLGRPVTVRMADEAATGAPAAASSGDRSPADDPVLRVGLRLFGGPLQPLDAADLAAGEPRPGAELAPDRAGDAPRSTSATGATPRRGAELEADQAGDAPAEPEQPEVRQWW